MLDQPATLTAPMDLEPHLPLVTHVVRQLASRVPSHVSREAMWVHGAVGLALAARRHDEDGAQGGPFGTGALRAVRAEVVAGLRREAPLPGNDDLARLLGTTTDVVARHRASLAEAATPSPRLSLRALPVNRVASPARWIAAPA